MQDNLMVCDVTLPTGITYRVLLDDDSRIKGLVQNACGGIPDIATCKVIQDTIDSIITENMLPE